MTEKSHWSEERWNEELKKYKDELKELNTLRFGVEINAYTTITLEDKALFMSCIKQFFKNVHKIGLHMELHIEVERTESHTLILMDGELIEKE